MVSCETKAVICIHGIELAPGSGGHFNNASTKMGAISAQNEIEDLPALLGNSIIFLLPCFGSYEIPLHVHTSRTKGDN